MDNLNLLAQIIGFGGTALTIIAYQQSKRKRILGCLVKKKLKIG
mgnify:CR=1 FL=1